MREIELKLTVDEPFVTPSLTKATPSVAGMEELPELDLRATYYDTPDLRLARRGVTLRYRSGEDGKASWTLKLPRAPGPMLDREEINFEGSPRKPPVPARDLITAFVRSAELQAVTRLRTRRRRWSLRDSSGTELAELVDDRVSVLQRNRVVGHFRELEVEARALEDRQLETIRDVLEGAGAAPTRTPKALRAMGARALTPIDTMATREVAPTDPAAFAVQRAIAMSLERMVSNDPGTRLGEPEALHQMRVATRRLRSDLRTFSSLVDRDWARALTDDLKQLGQALGAVRDLDVMRTRLEAHADGLPDDLGDIFSELATRHERVRLALLERLRDPSYVKLLDRLVDAAREPALEPAAWQPCSRILPQLAIRRARKLVQAGRRLGPGSPSNDLHALRIRAKRARYAAEAVAPSLGSPGEPLERFARRAEKIQYVLGELQDATVAQELVRELALGREATHRQAYAAGRLAERERVYCEAARERFPRAWKKLLRAAHRVRI